MNEEKIQAQIEEALNVETFDVLEYLEEQPVAVDEITIYTDVANARTLSGLLKERAQIIAHRKQKEALEDWGDLSIADAAEDTELDDDINALVEELEKTGLTFKLKTVAPALIRAIEKKNIATAKGLEGDELERHRQKGTAEVLARSIDCVVRGDGATDSTPYNAERLMKLEESLYTEQGQRLIGALYDMVYTGQVFEEALTVDFS